MDEPKTTDGQVDAGAFSISEALTKSVIATLERFGYSVGLPSLEWNLVRYPEALIIEGRPTRAEDAASCKRWAQLLRMTRYAGETGVRREAWFFNDELWCLKLISSVRSEDDARA